MPPTTKDALSPARGVQSIEVGGRLLQVLVDVGEPMVLKDLAMMAGLAPAQAHAYLVSYRKQQLVEQDVSAGPYRLGPFALLLGIARMRSFDPLRMAAEEMVGFVADIGHTATLSVWGNHGPTVIQIQEGPNQLYTNARAGTVYSVLGTATGRLFSAYLPLPLIRMFLAEEINQRHSSKLIGGQSPVRLPVKDLEAIRRRGVATIDPPPVPGVNALAGPVFNHSGQIQMAVTVIGPTRSLDVSDHSPMERRLLSFTSHLSAKLGCGSKKKPVAETRIAS